MSVPLDVTLSSLSSAGFEDGLGRRSVRFDREVGGIVECLHLRPELGLFEASLRHAAAQLSALDDERLPAVRGFERDGRGLVVLTDFVAGERLGDLIDAGRMEDAPVSGLDAALGLLLQALPALASMHSAGLLHGVIGPGRILLTATSQVVLLDAIYGRALQALRPSPRHLWTTFGIVAPSSGVRVDAAHDVAQVALAALATAVGRPLASDAPAAVTALIREAAEIAQIRSGEAFGQAIRSVFERMIGGVLGDEGIAAEAAAEEVRRAAREIGEDAALAALAELVRHQPPPSQSVPSTPARVPARPPEIPVDVAPRPARRQVPSAVKRGEDARIAAHEVQRERNEESPVERREVAPPAPEEPAREEVAPAERKEDAPVRRTEDAPARRDPELPAAEPSVQEPGERTPEIWHPPAINEPPPQTVPEKPGQQAAAAAEVRLSPQQPEAARSAPPPVLAPDPAPSVPREQVAEVPQPAPKTPLIRVAAVPEPEWIPQGQAPAAAASAPPAVTPVVSAPVAPPAPPPAAAAAIPVVAPPPTAVIVPAPTPLVAPASTPPAATMPPPVALPLPTPPVFQVAPPPAVPITPVVPPQPVAVAAPAPQAVAPAAPAAIRPISPATPAPQAPAAPAPQAPAAPLRIKAEQPKGYTPARTLAPISAGESIGRASHGAAGIGGEKRGGGFPFKVAAAAVVVLALGAFAGRDYLQGRMTGGPVAASPAATAKAAPVAPATGSLTVKSQPAGARVLVDGDEVGVTPITLDTIAPGRHVITVATETATVKRNVRIDAGKSVALDVPVYSGWVAVFSPIPLHVSEQGRALGTSDGRILLPPGRHLLTFTNREFAFTTKETVEIVAGEERAINLTPTGTVNLNAQPWAEVWVDGARVGETPLANLPVALGTREFVFKHPQYGERKVTMTVTTTSGPISVDFTKPARTP